MIEVPVQRDFSAWRRAARALLADDVTPSDVLWVDAESHAPVLPGFTGGEPATGAARSTELQLTVPREFLDAAPAVACHRDPARWSLLYHMLYRLTRGGERHLLDLASDDDVRQFHAMERAVRRDRHKMTAFVRFKRVASDEDDNGLARQGGDGSAESLVDPSEPGHYVAWHRPDHYIVRLTAPFFAKRFACLRWTILTPDESAAWDGTELAFGPGVPAGAAPAADELEDLWRTYYAHVFNPARIKLRAMKRELPVRHWPTLPETALIPDLLADAPRRVEEMMKRTSTKRTTKAEPNAPGRDADTTATDDLFAKPDGKGARVRVPKGPDAPEPSPKEKAACKSATSAAEFLPATRSLPQLAEAAKGCRGCDLYCNATQTVFGEGPADATVVFVGEQPGDREDVAGRPFVGPAGHLLDEALVEAGIPRDECYVTNTVKHFKFEPRGARRIHAKPNAREISACKPWLEAELATIRPKMVVCLGATAAQALLGRDFRVTQHRGEVLPDTPWAPWVLATVHPSSLLRIPDPAQRERSYAEFLDDLRAVARQLKVEKGK